MTHQPYHGEYLKERKSSKVVAKVTRHALMLLKAQTLRVVFYA